MGIEGMSTYTIGKGLDLPLVGAPSAFGAGAALEAGRAVREVALLGADYHGMKPRMIVAEGERVVRGQALFEDRKTLGVMFTAPGTGVVRAINRGDKRTFLSLVIALDAGDEGGEQATFATYRSAPVASLDRAAIEALLIESGLWTALRTRPYSKVPAPDTQPSTLFVTAIDSQPHAADVAAIVAGRKDDFRVGLEALRRLVEGNVVLCVAKGSAVDACGVAGVTVAHFAGKHPAGLAGTHMHLIEPASRSRTQWSIGAQDVLAIGHLFATGELDVRRVVALTGPSATQPRHVMTRIGASIDDLLQGEVAGDGVRVVSGSVLSGRVATGDVIGFLGRLHQQVSLLKEGNKRQFMGWLTAGASAYSTVRIYLSSLMPGKSFAMDTDTHGSARAMVPIGMYERVMPLDILPTFLLRALIVGDLETAEQLGALELDEEDLALCTFVCPGKIDYGAHLRSCLTQIEKEG
jgi:Na+-transporting NADH:ubiquinone oxidoreductase subunit A